MIDFLRINSTAALPIHLSDFNVSETNNGNVEITWETESEINNKEFVVQRSSKMKDWNNVAQMDGAGNSFDLISYSTIDKNPLNGTSYYRLKQTDFDGQESYSKVRLIKLDRIKLREEWIIYPNPAHERCIIEGKDIDFDNLRIFNLLGKSFINRDSIEKYEGNAVYIITTDLPTGTYIVSTGNTSKMMYIHH